MSEQHQTVRMHTHHESREPAYTAVDPYLPSSQQSSLSSSPESDTTSDSCPVATHRSADTNEVALVICRTDSVAGAESRIEVTNTLWRAMQSPPITLSSFRQLDPARIRSDPKLLHDLNFQHDVAFRPNYHGTQGKEKRARAAQYWEALETELQLYMQHSTQYKAKSALSAIESLSDPPRLRLRKMLETLAEILKTMVHGDDRASIDHILDTDLLMRQVRHGIRCLNDLSQWLSAVLKRVCSPARDQSIEEFAKKLERSTLSSNSKLMIQALEDLFNILETMKLDVANNQIQTLRLHMMATSTKFERYYHKAALDRGEDMSDSKAWFWRSCRDVLRPHKKAKQPEYFRAIGVAVVDLVADPKSCIPDTFAFDHQRLLRLRHDFQYIIAEVAVVRTYVMLHRRLASARWPATTDLYKLLHRIRQLHPLGFQCKTPLDVLSTPVVIEIVRSAYLACGIAGLPTVCDEKAAYDYLQSLLSNSSCDPETSSIILPSAYSSAQELKSAGIKGMLTNQSRSRYHSSLHLSLWDTLKDLVKEEAPLLSNKSSLEILALYSKPHDQSRQPTVPSAQQVPIAPLTLRAGPGSWPALEEPSPHEPDRYQSSERLHGLRALALRVAHLSIVHWQVWGDILYEVDS